MATVPRSHMVNADGDLVCVLRNGTTEIAGHVRGEDGKTPPGLDHLSTEDGNLFEHMTDGRVTKVGYVQGKDGRDGKDGKDGAPGVGFDDMDSVFDGERTVTMRWAKDGRVHERSFRLAVPIYRKVWKQDVDYEVGDMVTYAGGLWTCVQATKNKPGDGEANGWQLAVKGAKNGKSTYELARAEGFRGTEKEWLASLKGPEGKPGPMGPPGRDRT